MLYRFMRMVLDDLESSCTSEISATKRNSLEFMCFLVLASISCNILKKSEWDSIRSLCEQTMRKTFKHDGTSTTAFIYDGKGLGRILAKREQEGTMLRLY